MAGLAFLGFCMIYMLRVNLSVAIVAMTTNRTHTSDDGSIAVVRIHYYILEKLARQVYFPILPNREFFYLVYL